MNNRKYSMARARTIKRKLEVGILAGIMSRLGISKYKAHRLIHNKSDPVALVALSDELELLKDNEKQRKKSRPKYQKLMKEVNKNTMTVDTVLKQVK